MENEIGETISMISLSTKAHRFASRPSTDQIFQKNVLFGNPKRNSTFFYPSVFYIFATQSGHKNSWTETAKTLTDSGLTMTEDRRPACNTGLAQWRVTCYYDSLVVKETLVFQMNISANNPPLRQALNRFTLSLKY